MKILLVDTGSYTLRDLYSKLSEKGIVCRILGYSYDHNEWELKYHNDKFETVLRKELELGYDAVITTNFFPLIARKCHEKGTKYISWSYDAPMNLPLIEEMEHPTNYVFLFDEKDAQKYRAMGFEHFWHLPLAVNCDRLEGVASNEDYNFEVSFVGQLYKSTLPMLRSIMNPYQQEFVDKIVQTQLKIYGKWFVSEMLTDSIIEDMNSYFRSVDPNSIQITSDQLAYSIAQQITYLERLTIIKLMSSIGIRVDLYTDPLEEPERGLLDKVNIHGRVSYEKEMPALFRTSKINLNPTLKIIQSGIPLRALDIMGSGGFLLSNYQPEIDEYFADGEDVVMYKSMEEAVEKAKYYLAHDDVRRKVSLKGHEKVRKYFNYEDRIAEIFKLSGLDD